MNAKPWVTLLVVLSVGVAACGGPPTPGPNNPPTASFTAMDTIQAGTPLGFDASTSNDPDGDTLAFSWAFGDGTRGGAQKIAHVFTKPGSFKVKLTVGDGRGGTANAEKTITVTPGPAPLKTVTALTVVRDSGGAALAGVTVSVVGGTSNATTGSDGKASLSVGVGVPVTLKFVKNGFTQQFKVLELPASAESGYLEAALMAREPAQTLPDAAAGGSLNGKHGSRISLPANALVDADGNPVTGAVQVNLSPVDVGSNVESFPGKFEGIGPTGQQGIILSYGTTEYALSKGGQELNIAPGARATIEIPVYTALNRDGSVVKLGDTYPMWSLDEQTGTWIQEGQGTVVASSTSPSGFALRGEVTHFSWWNHDIFDGPPYRPKPRCLVDTNYDGQLEDLTGTGYCWHYGTGPEQPSKAALRAQATQRIPAYAASDTTPVAGGKILPIPADLDITLRSSAKNGTLAGTTILRGPAGKEEDVTVVLYPVGSGGNCTTPPTIALPHDQTYTSGANNQSQCFNLNATAGSSFEVRVSQNGSSLTGTLRVTKPGGAVDSASFGSQPGSVVISNAAAGTHRIEVQAGTGGPGGYRLEVRALQGSCASPPTIGLPHDQTYNFNTTSQVQCFNVALGVNDVLEAKVPNFSSGVQGSLRVYAPSGEKIGEDGFGGTFNAGFVLFGAAQAGNHRVEVVITNASSGNFRLQASKSNPEVIGVPDSRTVSGTANGGRVRYLLNAPSGQAVGLTLTAQNGQHGVAAYPSGASVLASCQSCSQPSTESFVQNTPPSARMVLEVFRNNGSGTSQFTLATSTPTNIAFNTDVNASLVAGQQRIYTFAGNEGQEVSLGMAFSQGNPGFTPAFKLMDPGGAQVSNADQSRIAVLPKTGTYGLVVSALSGSGNYTLRLNNAAPPVPLSLQNPLTEVTTSLALGERKRYALSPNLNQAEVFALKLATTQTSYATAMVNPFVNLFNALVSIDSGTGAQTKVSNGIYVRTGGAYMLELYSSERFIERLGGQLTVGILKPTPQTAAVDTALNGNLNLGQMLAYGFNVPADRYYLLRAVFGSATCCLQATVWGPSTPFANYTGEFTANNGTFGQEAKGLLKAGINTLTLLNTFNPSNVSFTAQLVTLENPTDITPGAAALNGSIDVAGERDYYRFTATAGQNFTLNASGGLAGTVRVFQLALTGDFTSGASIPPFNPASPLGSHSFTTPNAGTYIIEIDGTDAATGAYSLSLSSP